MPPTTPKLPVPSISSRTAGRLAAIVAAGCLAVGMSGMTTAHADDTSVGAPVGVSASEVRSVLSTIEDAELRANATELLAKATRTAASSKQVSAASKSRFSASSPFTGDGEWAPSHDEELAIIPICAGPVGFLKWLIPNFADHGRDLSKFVEGNFELLVAILNGSAQPWRVLELILKPFLQIPVYAVNDTLFHIPATLRDILGFCASVRD
ncbi:hypothetical protein ACF3NT_08960 [Naumannella halotolerans]|uniref:hypothetical protein n=1 Tax=Naumannella halotolerans TaxID=993414 RepID=UPI00370D18A9